MITRKKVALCIYGIVFKMIHSIHANSYCQFVSINCDVKGVDDHSYRFMSMFKLNKEPHVQMTLWLTLRCPNQQKSTVG